MESKKNYGNVSTKRNTPTIIEVIEMAKKNGAVTWYQGTTNKGGVWMTNQSLAALARELINWQK